MISVLTQDEIRRFGGTTLADLLIRIPGLVGSSIYMTDRSVISPRGDQLRPSSSNVLLLINGRPVREQLEGGIKSEVLESFPIDVIERIEVIKGPGSVLYGTKAVSAVINVITKTPERNGVTVSGMGTDGGFNTSATVDAQGRRPPGPGRRVLPPRSRSGRRTTSSRADAGGAHHDREPITIPNKGPGAYLGANYKGFRLSAAYAGWDNSFFLPDFTAQGSAGRAGTSASRTPGGATRSPSNWRTDVDVTYARSKFSVDANPFITRDSHEAVAEWTNFVDLPRRSQIVFGGLYDRVSGSEVYHGLGFPITISDASPWSAAGYAQLDVRVVDSFKLTGGFQVNKIKGRDADWVPRLGAILTLPRRIPCEGSLRRGLPRAQHQRAVARASRAAWATRTSTRSARRTSTSASATSARRGQVTASYFRNKQTDIIIQDRSHDAAPLRERRARRTSTGSRSRASSTSPSSST